MRLLTQSTWMKKIVIYDFDGSLNKRDSLRLLLKYTCGPEEMFYILVNVLHKKLVGGLERYKYETIKSKWDQLKSSNDQLQSFKTALKSSIEDKILHLHSLDEKYILSGSFYEIIEHAIEEYPNIHVIASKLDANEDPLNSRAKASWLSELLRSNGNTVTAYGNSIGDLRQLKYVDSFFLRIPILGFIKIK